MRLHRLLILCVALGFFLAARAETSPRPNVVMVLIDDMGWADLSCFGNTEAKTPNIDRLAAEGGRFSRFYVNSPICSPSRCALMTGQYPQRWRITSYLDNRAANERRGMAQWLDPQAPTLARSLQQAGWATGHFGKWHLGGQRDVDDAPPIAHYGFDRSLTNFEGMGAKLLPLTQSPGQREPGRIWADAERLGQPVTWMQRSEITGAYVAAALRFIDDALAQAKPFYVNVWPDDVHTPLWPPLSDWREGKRAKYLAVLEVMDRQLGVLFDRIRTDERLRERTFIVLCSDNGPEPGAGRAGNLRGAKGTLFEGGTRSPLIAWGPGFMAKDRAGFHDDTSVLAAIDLPPSILTLCGVKPSTPVACDGIDALPTLLGQARLTRPRPIFWRRPPDRKTLPTASDDKLPDLAVIDGEWKLLCDTDGSRPRLHRITADPGESNDLSATQPETVARLTKAVLTWHATLPPDAGTTPKLPNNGNLKP